jgi:hypothetical protein
MGIGLIRKFTGRVSSGNRWGERGRSPCVARLTISCSLDALDDALLESPSSVRPPPITGEQWARTKAKAKAKLVRDQLLNNLFRLMHP